MTALKPLDNPVTDASADTVDQYLQILDDAKAKGLTDLADFASLIDGAGVKRDSELWASRFLTDAASPYRPDVPVKRQIHKATDDLPDVLRHEYDLAFDQGRDLPRITLHMIVEETVGWIRIQAQRKDLDLRTLPPDQRAAAISWVAERILRLRGSHRGKADEDAPHEWTFLYSSLDDGARFSTDATKVEFNMWSWADRVDGGIRDGQPYFLGFKKHEPASGKIISLNPDHWFDGKCWDTYRRR